CEEEYVNLSDRRFHAQPIACNNCGPKYKLKVNHEINDFKNVLLKACELLNDGKILLIKGLGGFHMACDALNVKAIDQLREIKIREKKPFAILFKTIGSIEEYAYLSEEEKHSLLSWRRPIVLLESKGILSEKINPGLSTLGAFLPYMPIHYMLFERLNSPAIVLTSGNLSDEPIYIQNDIAYEVFHDKTDGILDYNRKIYNRTDDSVCRVMHGKERIFRRSRGYAPVPLYLKQNVDSILATGAELVNCFCIGKGNQAILSQHIGDLKNYETLEFFEETIEKFTRLYRVEPELIACDLHPDYLSTRYAESKSQRKVYVQHHHAHIASCMAECGLDEPVIGISFDGTGYGTDQHIWGSEFIITGLDQFERFAHFEYMPMPGGDAAVKEPWRMAVSFLKKYIGDDYLNIDLPFLNTISRNKLLKINDMIDKDINSPLSCGAGRLFDAVAALLNICTISNHHAEAPMRLESQIVKRISGKYDVELDSVISFHTMFEQMISDILTKSEIKSIATKFHNTMVDLIHRVAEKMRKETGIQKLVLSGGTFQNKYLVENLVPLLYRNDFDVYLHEKIPPNDGGIALGQLVIAAKKMKHP
ncbi:carbamoyltransferase HypF, partial [Bacteroidota bacterium]